MKRLNKKGFTLVELLAVIVILALLMVVAARVIGGVTDNAREEALKTEGQKIFAKTYEDVEISNVQGGSVNYSYSGVADSGYTETPYTVKVTVGTGSDSKNVITAVCATDGNRKIQSSSITGNTITWGPVQTGSNLTCSNSQDNQDNQDNNG